MRLYFVPEATETDSVGTTITRPAFGGMSVEGSWSHLRGGYLCSIRKGAHSDLVGLTGVTFIPLVDSDSRPLDWDDPVSAIPQAIRGTLRDRLEARGIPMDGIGLSDTIESVVKRLHRRIVVRQILRTAGLEDIDGLDTADNFRTRLEALRARLIDVSDLTETKPRDLLAKLLPRIKGVRVRPWTGALRGGTFTDDFTGTSGQNIEARTGWTRVGGAAGAAQVNASNQLKYASSTATQYICTDQGSADQYTQVQTRWTTHSTAMFDVGVRMGGDGTGAPAALTGIGFDAAWFGAARLWRFDNAASATELGIPSTGAAGDIVRVEAEGTSIEVFYGGVSVLSPVTESTYQAQTGQGFFVREASDPRSDDFEAGTLGVVAAGDDIPGFLQQRRRRAA